MRCLLLKQTWSTLLWPISLSLNLNLRLGLSSVMLHGCSDSKKPFPASADLWSSFSKSVSFSPRCRPLSSLLPSLLLWRCDLQARRSGSYTPDVPLPAPRCCWRLSWGHFLFAVNHVTPLPRPSCLTRRLVFSPSSQWNRIPHHATTCVLLLLFWLASLWIFRNPRRELTRHDPRLSRVSTRSPRRTLHHHRSFLDTRPSSSLVLEKTVFSPLLCQSAAWIMLPIRSLLFEYRLWNECQTPEWFR